MSNLTDALIAAKLLGNGGGGGGSGLPPIGKTETELFNDTMAFAQGGSAYSGAALVDFSTVVGQQYVINWDGTPYTCTAVDIGSGFGTVGNLAIAGAGEDTGEPFIGYATEGTLVLMTASTAASHAVKIDGEIQSPSDSTALVVVNGEWSLQSGYAFEDNGVITPFSSDFLPTLMYAFEYTTTSEKGINANKYSNYIIDASAFDSFTENNRTYPVVIYGININTNSGHADFDFAVPYAYYQNGQICIGINNVKDTPLVIPSGSKISGVLLIPKVIQLT